MCVSGGFVLREKGRKGVLFLNGAKFGRKINSVNGKNSLVSFSVSLLVCLFVSQFVCLSACQFVCLYLSACQFVCLCLSVNQFVCLYLSVSQSLSMIPSHTHAQTHKKQGNQKERKRKGKRKRETTGGRLPRSSQPANETPRL